MLLLQQQNILETDLNEERFTNLEMKSNKYLNAGVMFIDLTKWRNQRVYESLIETQIRMGSRLIYWDQDVFNSFLTVSTSKCLKN